MKVMIGEYDKCDGQSCVWRGSIGMTKRATQQQPELGVMWSSPVTPRHTTLCQVRGIRSIRTVVIRSTYM